MFTQLSEKISGVFKKLGNKGKVREEDIESALRDVRLALLEADVHFTVVKDFLSRLKERVVGQNSVQNLSPAQQFFTAVQEELVRTLGGESKNLVLEGRPPHVILMVGLQGSGKTTTSAKLALHFRKKGRRPFLVPADQNRPAAVEQLKTLSRQIEVPCFATDLKRDVLKNVQNAVKEADERFCDIVIVDTAGRLHVDTDLMDELKRLKKKLVEPRILFVADAMTGQEAVNVAKAFHDALTIEGVILTKMDGDAKGGAALSIQSVAGCPIHFVGMGEKLGELESFQPERLVSRLLDRGDILTLIEKAQEVMDENVVGDLAKKLKKNEFDLEDFRQQLKQVKKIGSLGSMMKLIPGAQKLGDKLNLDQAEKELKKKEAIINSMTLKERRHPDVLNGSRRARIAQGSGTSVQDINRFMKEFEQMRKMMKMFSKGGMGALGGMMSKLGM